MSAFHEALAEMVRAGEAIPAVDYAEIAAKARLIALGDSPTVEAFDRVSKEVTDAMEARAIAHMRYLNLQTKAALLYAEMTAAAERERKALGDGK